MAILPAVLQGGATLGTTAIVLYTAPTNTKAVVKKATFTNISTGTVTLTVSIGRNGGGALTVTNAQAIPAGQAYIAVELGNHVLGPGDTLNAVAGTAAALNAIVSGYTVA